MLSIREVIIKISFALLCFLSFQAYAAEKNEVVFETNKGQFVIQLNPVAAPETVKNFRQYVESGSYNGTIFHRVIAGFMIQGGGFDENMGRKATRESINNEANNGLKNLVGTIAMARTSAPHSATNQFFINVNDNSNLDFKAETPSGWGYAVFGKVIENIELVLQISKQATDNKKGFANVPVDAVVIEKVYLR